MMIRWLVAIGFFPVALVFSGCTAKHYRKSADRQVYRIIAETQGSALGRTNAFSVDTPYSSRDPKSIAPAEIIEDRLKASRRIKIGLEEALELGVRQSRAFQLRKEQLYLAALTLTKDRHDFQPQFFGSISGTASRDSTDQWSGKVHSQIGVTELMTSGANLGVTLANDILHYYTGSPRHSALSLLSVNLVQPLLRGAGAQVAAENLTQSERNVVYDVRSFALFQMTFAVDIVTSYFRLLQQKDAVRNEYNNYQNLVLARDRAEALSVDRLPRFQVDQARQDELRAKSRYLQTVARYQSSVDQFKNTLGMTLGTELDLDDAALDDLVKAGLPPVLLDETNGYRLAVEHRFDVLNEIDRFEDSKRKIKVAANQLRPSLNFVGGASLNSEGRTDYARFRFEDYRADVGLQLNLPFDRLVERNAYRATLISFEREIRVLAQSLDDTKNKIRGDLRTLEQTRQDFDIQKVAADLADRRVESASLLLQAGRAQIRDQLEAQAAQLQARNAVTQSVVDYHVARLGLLIDLGLLDIDQPKFWIRDHPRLQTGEPVNGSEVVPPEKLFGTK